MFSSAGRSVVTAMLTMSPSATFATASVLTMGGPTTVISSPLRAVTVAPLASVRVAGSFTEVPPVTR